MGYGNLDAAWPIYITQSPTDAEDVLSPVEGVQVLGVSFPIDTDYIAIPAVIVSVLTLVLVSLATAKPEESDWREFIEV